MQVRRNLATGEIIDFVEVAIDDDTGGAKASAEAREPHWAGQFLDSDDFYLQASTQNLKLTLDEGILVCCCLLVAMYQFLLITL